MRGVRVEGLGLREFGAEGLGLRGFRVEGSLREFGVEE